MYFYLGQSFSVVFTSNIILLILVEPCKTKTGHKCIFPFTYQGVQHNKCTTVGKYSWRELEPWCAYKVDGKNEIVNSKWDYCKTSCGKL